MKKIKKSVKLTKAAEKRLLKRLQNKADKVFSLYVRERDNRIYNKICPLCNKKPIQCCFHFLSRVRIATRWLDKNVVGACKNCNLIEQFIPDWSRYWYLKKYPLEQYLQLVEEARTDFKATAPYLENVILAYSSMLEDLKKGVK